MNELSIMSESLGLLWELPAKGGVCLDDIPWQVRPDLQKFIVGETLSMKEGRVAIGNNLYKKWLLKIKTKGFDYEIDWKQ